MLIAEPCLVAPLAIDAFTFAGAIFWVRAGFGSASDGPGMSGVSGANASMNGTSAWLKKASRQAE